MASGGGKYSDYGFIKKALLVWTHEGSDFFALKWLNPWAFDPLVVIPPAFVVLFIFAYSVDPDAVVATWAMVVALSPLWLPVALGIVFWITWIHYIRFAYWFSPMCESVLLEIQLPPEVEKTPLAMEAFLTALAQTGGETTFVHRIWRGQTRAIFSLEIASNEGRIGYYLHCRKSWKDIVEARLYGQFPEARITVVEDYASKVPFNLEDYNLFGSEYKKREVAALPIKTYIDWELDKNPDKPENTVDPITNILELLGTMGKGEHYWLQIMLRARKSDEWYGFYLSKDSYLDTAKEAIKKITQTAIDRAKDLTTDEMEKNKVGSRGAMLMTETEKRQVEAIERSRGKLVFDCGIRVAYISRKENTRGINNANVIRFFTPFMSMGLTNVLGPTRGTSYFDFPWQFESLRQPKEQRNLFFNYRHRAYFFVPYDQVPVFMTTEEIASLWHFPSSVVKTPGLSRVPAKVSEAPTNLPV